MRKLPKMGLMMVAVVAAFTGWLLVAGERTAEARPQYLKAFKKQYPKVEKATCAACHPEDNKKVRNDYGKAFGGGLPGKNCKDADKLSEALTGAEEKENGDGKKFGDILKDGKLPN